MMGGCLRIFGGIVLIVGAIILSRFVLLSSIHLLSQGPIGIIIVIALIAGAIFLFIKILKSLS